MKIVIHADSAYDMLYFNRWLKKEQWEVLGLFYNPNVHPHAEYNRDLLMEKLISVLEDIIMMYPEYNFEEYLKGSAPCATQRERCAFCYRFILDYTARYAKQLGIPYFSTSWMLNPKHDQALLRKIGDECAEQHGVKFMHHDFSAEWKVSAELAEKMNVYKAPYCGCVYSERYGFYPTTLAEYEKEHTGNGVAELKKQSKRVAAKK